MRRILKAAIESEEDVLGARQRARLVAQMSGFARQDQVRIATAVSELARNVYAYAGRGTVEFSLQDEGQPALVVLVEDKGPGIRNPELVLSGAYQSDTGMGLGLVCVRRLMDDFSLDTAAGAGTRVTVKKKLPAVSHEVTPEDIARLHRELLKAGAHPGEELHQQNQDLMQAWAELKSRQDELSQMARELEDTNRGVVALYAELDEKAAHLRRADELKSRFLSNISHEFRTPLNSIRALARLLLSREDGDLSSEQEKQVNFIVKSTESLMELVNDLLDLAKIEAGRVDVHPVEFVVEDMFSALRGMLRPLLQDQHAVRLAFEDHTNGAAINTDEAKVAQILRNFISNALKFTEQGEIRVSAELVDGGQTVRFAVADTGIGIARENHGLIFEEFGQVQHRLQHKVRGTGLGLPLCRKLAALLGGTVGLDSDVGQGSTFYTILPRCYGGEQNQASALSGAAPVREDA